MLVGEIQNGVNEMLITAQTAGLDIDTVIKGIKAGGGQNFYLDSKSDSIKKKDFSPKFSFQNMQKDMNLAIELAEQLRLNLPGLKIVSEMYNTGVNLFKNEDFSASIKVVEKFVKK
jgi:3-hydroxyisobutyrate dehydrogenase